MPTYVYERPDGSRFEIRQGFNDPHLAEDPETGVPVRRVFQAPPVIFKGSGWYKTDSRATTNNASATSAPAKTETPTEGATTGEKSAATAETKSESKPEAKSEVKPEAKSGADKPAPAAAT